MIATNTEFYSSPYYFFLRDKGDKYSLYFSVEGTLTEARKKDEVIHFKKESGDKVKKHIKKIAKEKKIKTTKELKTDLEELVNLDGALSNSKIPILDPKLHPKKTMDQTVAAARITNDPLTRGYRTYYGEGVDTENDLNLNEVDYSEAFGYEETKDMDGNETFKYLVDEMGMSEDEAKERCQQFGKDWTGKRDEKSEFYDDKNFIMKGTISEIQKQKMIKVVEDILMGKKKTDNSDVTKKKEDMSDVVKNKLPNTIDELPLLIRKNLKTLLNHVEKNGYSKEDLIKLIKKSE